MESSTALFDPLDTKNTTWKYQMKKYPESLDKYKHIVEPSLIVLLILAILAILTNGCVLFLTRFASGGKFSTLVYVRSLCVGDMMCGFCGILKYSFVTQQPKWTNCFLPDSLLVCAFIAQLFVLVGLFADNCLNLTSHHGKDWQADKYTTIFGMVLIWNGAFICAFMPQMGWNESPYSCEFFVYHSVQYLSFVSLLFFLTLVTMIILCIVAMRFSSVVRRKTNVTMVTLIEIDRIVTTTRTALIDAGFQVIAFMPLVIYILLHCSTCIYSSVDYSDVYFLLLISVILLKAVIMPIIRCKRTTEITNVIVNLHLDNCTSMSGPSDDVADTQESSASVRSVRYSDKNQVFSIDVESKHEHTQAKPNPQSRGVSLRSLKSGLLNASSLATAAAAAVRLPDQPSFVCEKCGHSNGATNGELENGAHMRFRHPLQLVYGGKQWQNMRRRSHSLLSSNASSTRNKAIMSDPQWLKTSSQDRLPPITQPIGLKQRSQSVILPQRTKQVTFNHRQRSNSTSFVSESGSSSRDRCSHGSNSIIGNDVMFDIGNDKDEDVFSDLGEVNSAFEKSED